MLGKGEIEYEMLGKAKRKRSSYNGKKNNRKRIKEENKRNNKKIFRTRYTLAKSGQ